MIPVLIAACVWSLSGVITAAILARHGHNFWLFATMGLAYGPLLLVVWFQAAEGQSTALRMIESPQGDRPPVASDRTSGWIDVLIGLDGSAHSVESTRQLLELLGPAVGRVRLTSALDHEVSNSHDQFQSDERRIEYLRDAANALGLDGTGDGAGNVELALASGQPDIALVDQARLDGFDVVLVAHRRHPFTSLVRGSTTSRLARSADLPVLIGPPV